jgi:hypothetical protein
MSWQPDYDRDTEGDTRPNSDDACPVCDKIDCVCPEDVTPAELRRRIADQVLKDMR